MSHKKAILTKKNGKSPVHHQATISTSADLSTEPLGTYSNKSGIKIQQYSS